MLHGDKATMLHVHVEKIGEPRGKGALCGFPALIISSSREILNN